MKVLILPKYDSTGASSRYRHYNYLDYFERHDMHCVFKPLLEAGYITHLYNKRKELVFFQKVYSVFKRFFFLLRHSKKYDLIIIEKELFPNIPYFVEKFLLRNRIYTMDFDDYIASGYKLNPFKRFFLGNKIDLLANGAQFVTVGNHWYFDEIKSKNLIYLPTVIDLNCYPNVKQNHATDIITIVWIGSPSTAEYLLLIIPVLQRLNKKYPIRFKVIGAKIPPVENLEIVFVNWSAETEADELLTSDIGVMPLKETLWEKGKCGFKLIQYMACGLPVVASALTANMEIVEDGIVGFIVTNDQEWYHSLERLILDENLRKKMGKQGRKKIETDYSYQTWGDRYSNYLKKNQLSLNEKNFRSNSFL